MFRVAPMLVLLVACSGGDPSGVRDAQPAQAADAAQPDARTGPIEAGLPARNDASYEPIDAMPPACGMVELRTRRVTPTVHLLVDASGSMASQWPILQDALAGDAGVVTRLDAQVAFGLSTYRVDGGECPLLHTEPPALENRSRIWNAFETETPGGNTPTAQALDAARALLLAHPVTDFSPEGPRSIVLATDGAPEGCDLGDSSHCEALEGDARSMCFAQARADHRDVEIEKSVVAARAISDAGMRLFVISVANMPDLADGLQRVANAGAGLDDGDDPAELFRPAGIEALTAALAAIIGEAGSCRVELLGELVVDRACEGSVLLNDEPVACDAEDGFVALDPRAIELRGEACERFQTSSAATLVARFPCEVAFPD